MWIARREKDKKSDVSIGMPLTRFKVGIERNTPKTKMVCIMCSNGMSFFTNKTFGICV